MKQSDVLQQVKVTKDFADYMVTKSRGVIPALEHNRERVLRLFPYTRELRLVLLTNED